MSLEPERFVSSFEGKKHIVIFSEDPMRTRKLEFEFLSNGLERGEICVYASSKDSVELIEREMKENGTDVQRFTEDGLLRIYNLPSPIEDSDPIKSMNRALEAVLPAGGPPFRFVNRLCDPDDDKKIEADMIVEHYIQTSYEKMNGSTVCSYDVSGIEPKHHGRWLIDLLANHHSALFLPKNGKGIAMNMR